LTYIALLTGIWQEKHRLGATKGANLAPLTEKDDAWLQHREKQREEALLRKEKAAQRQLPESLYAISKNNGKKSKLAFLSKTDDEAGEVFCEYLMTHRKKTENEILFLIRIGTYDPGTLAFKSEAEPVITKASDDAEKLVIRPVSDINLSPA